MFFIVHNNIENTLCIRLSLCLPVHLSEYADSCPFFHKYSSIVLKLMYVIQIYCRKSHIENVVKKANNSYTETSRI